MRTNQKQIEKLSAGVQSDLDDCGMFDSIKKVIATYDHEYMVIIDSGILELGFGLLQNINQNGRLISVGYENNSMILRLRARKGKK